MRTLAGVKSVAFGGLPKEGPIQGIGGVKGSQVLSGLNILQYAEIAYLNATESQRAILTRLSSLPIQRSTAMALNVRDSILPSNVNDGTPAQFIRENSDCRLYYTEQMIVDITAVWKAAADSAFNGKKCAFGELPTRAPVPDSVSVTATDDDISHSPHNAGMKLETKYVTTEGNSPIQNEKWRALHEQVIVV